MGDAVYIQPGLRVGVILFTAITDPPTSHPIPSPLTRRASELEDAHGLSSAFLAFAASLVDVESTATAPLQVQLTVA
jgi:hypothetical protein